MGARKRVVIYVPEEFLEKLRSAYPECRTESEVIVKHLFEVHAAWMGHRSFPCELTGLARSYLITKYGREYLSYLSSIEPGEPPDQVTRSTCGRPGKEEKSTKPSEKKRKKSIRDYVAEKKVQFLSEMQWIKNVDKFIEKAEEEGIVVIKGEKDVAFVDKIFLNMFLNKLKTYPYHEEKWKELSEPERRLLEFLRSEGMIYYDHKDLEWKLAVDINVEYKEKEEHGKENKEVYEEA